MNTKRIVFFTALVILIFVFVVNNPIMFGFCQGVSVSSYGSYCYDSAVDIPETVSLLGLFLGGFLLLSSAITYKMKEEVFQTWWRFARWWVLVIIAVTLLLQNAGGGGGIGISGAVGGAFDTLVLGIFYAILVITSLVKILRAYLKTKN